MTKYYKKFLENEIEAEESLELFSHIVKERKFSYCDKRAKQMIKVFFQRGWINENGEISVSALEELEKFLKQVDDEEDKEEMVKFFKR